MSGNARGMVAMLLAMGAFAVMDVALKVLAGYYPAAQVAALRGLTALPLVLLHVGWLRQWNSLWRVRWGLHGLRAVLTVAMLMGFAHGLQALSLTAAYVLFFVAPLLIALLSGPLLGERVRPSSWLALALGLAGVWVAMGQGLAEEGRWWASSAALAVLAAAVAYALAAVLGRLVSRTDSSAALVWWTTVGLAAGGSALAAPQWQPLELAHAPWLALLAVAGLAGQVAIVEAFRHGQAAVVAPMEYSALAWGVLLDVAVWQVWPSAATWAGAGLVLASGWVLVRGLR